MGAGAFGPQTYGAPTTPTAASYTPMNQSPILNQMTATTNAGVGSQQRQTGSAGNAAGAGGSAGVAATNRDIAAQGQLTNANAYNQANVANASAQNAFNQNEQQLAQQQYATNAGLYNTQEANRQNAISQLPGGQLVNLFGGQGGY